MASGIEIVKRARQWLPLLLGVLAAVLVLVGVFLIDQREAESYRRAGVLAQMDMTRARFEEALQDRLQLARGLAAFAKSRNSFTENEFLEFAQALESKQKGIRSLQLAPGGVVTYFTKPELNEVARGHDILADLRNRDTVQMAINRRHLIVVGPSELIQGGVAIIGRLPIYKPDPQSAARFWGFATVLLDLEPLLLEAGIGIEEHGLDYAFSSADSVDAPRTVFSGDASIFEQASAMENIAVPSGSWQIAAVPNVNWPRGWPGRHWLSMIGSALALVAGLLIHALVRRPLILERRVDQATRALRLSEERYKTLATVAPVGIYQLVGDHELVFVNEQWRRITGVSGSHYDNDAYRKMIHPDDRAITNPAWDDLLRKNMPFSIEYRFNQPNGKEIWLLETAMPQGSDDRQKPLFIASVVDITDRRMAEMEVVRTNAELEQFALIASHDLKAPLRAVKGYCLALQEEYAGSLDHTAQGYLQSALEGAARMRQLIQDLLEFSRAGHREQIIEQVDCHEVLTTVLSDLGFEIERLSAKIDVRELPTLCADRNELGQLFQNLIGNSLKYCKDVRPEVTVSADYGRAHWCISVCDNGIGISDENAEQIFDVFKRLHSRDEYSGTGIGLAICKKIVERNGGRIWIDVTYEGGTKVCFTWPAVLQDTPDPTK